MDNHSSHNQTQNIVNNHYLLVESVRRKVEAKQLIENQISRLRTLLGSFEATDDGEDIGPIIKNIEKARKFMTPAAFPLLIEIRNLVSVQIQIGPDTPNQAVKDIFDTLGFSQEYILSPQGDVGISFLVSPKIIEKYLQKDANLVKVIDTLSRLFNEEGEVFEHDTIYPLYARNVVTRSEGNLRGLYNDFRQQAFFRTEQFKARRNSI